MLAGESMQPSYLGIEIGGSKLQMALGPSGASPLRQWRWPVEAAKGAAGIRESMEAHLPAIIHEHAPLAVGVGFGGPVDRLHGRISRSFHVQGWAGFDLASWLGLLTGLPVHLDNDANVAALAEARHGVGRGHDPVFYVTLGSGVGGGLVVDNEIYHGAAPGEAEIGHLRLDRTGTELESRCSGWAIDARIRHATAITGAGGLARLTAQLGETGGEARILKQALHDNDPEAQRILSDLGRDLGFGLSHVVHLMHPKVIILGGGLSLIGEPLRAAVSEALGGFLMPGFAPGPPIKLAALAEAAVPVRAIELARDSARVVRAGMGTEHAVAKTPADS